MNDNFDNYVKGEQFNAIMGDLLGSGIFTTDGAQWYVQRKVAAHLFKRAELEGYMTKYGAQSLVIIHFTSTSGCLWTTDTPCILYLASMPWSKTSSTSPYVEQP